MKRIAVVVKKVEKLYHMTRVRALGVMAKTPSLGGETLIPPGLCQRNEPERAGVDRLRPQNQPGSSFYILFNVPS